MELVNLKIQFFAICVLLFSRVAIAGDDDLEDDRQEDDETSPDQHRQLASVPDIKMMSQEQQNTNSQVSVGSHTPVPDIKMMSQEQQNTNSQVSVGSHTPKQQTKRGGHRRKKRKSRLAGLLPNILQSSTPPVVSQSPQKASQSSPPPPPPSVSQSPPKASQSSTSPQPPPQVSRSPPQASQSSKSPPQPKVSQSPPNPPPPPPQVSKTPTTQPDELHKPLAEGVTHKQAFLEEHNKIRAKMGQALYQWNKTIADWAQNWANHSMEDCKMEHSGGPYGENQFWGGKSHWTAIDVVRSWGDESVFYDPNVNRCQLNQPCGHYTQIVWKDSKQVGCAIVECKNGQGTLAICNYDPPGNFRTEHPFDDNITKYQERLRTGKRP